MRNKKEFEEYVRELTQKKLENGQRRRAKIHKISFGIGGCAAAAICAALLLNAGVWGGGYKSGSDKVLSEETANGGNGLLTDSDVKGENMAPPQEENYTDKEPSYTCGLPNGSAQDGFDSDDGELPQYVDVYRGGSGFRLCRDENIRRLVRELNGLELGGRVDKSGGEGFITLEFVYSDRTISYGFTKDSVSVGDFGSFAVSAEELSKLDGLLDSLAEAEE
ncbi:MAG: hypothetical protein NC223_01285 [Butyrivibrio sp.]|nr:hypothetical protein [Butyrivibrio sp.]